MSDVVYSKDTYREIARTEGLQAAVKRLHHDLWTLEQECFDTPEGYRADLWKKLNELRIFSRELWDEKLN
jgi:choline kinase